MFFNMRRYLYAVTQNLNWLFIALIPLAAYLLISGIRVDRFTITRSFKINPESPVAVTTSPIDTLSLKKLLVTPKYFFTDPLSLENWKRQAETSPDLAQYDFKNKQTILEMIKSLSLTLDSKGNVAISYMGPDMILGTQLTNYYTKRLLSRLRAGLHRKPAATSEQQNLNFTPLPQFEKTNFKKIEHNSWWRNERLETAVIITILPCIILLIIIGFKEFTDPSFKSGRQAARYLNLPILGFFPSLEPLILNLKEKNMRDENHKKNHQQKMF